MMVASLKRNKIKSAQDKIKLLICDFILIKYDGCGLEEK